MHNIFFCGKRADRSCQLVMNNVNDLKSFSGIPSIGIYRERGRTVSTTIYHLVIENVSGLETTFQIRFATCYFFLFFLVAVARKKMCRMLHLIGFDSDGNNTSQRRMRITPSINFSFFLLEEEPCHLSKEFRPYSSRVYSKVDLSFSKEIYKGR